MNPVEIEREQRKGDNIKATAAHHASHPDGIALHHCVPVYSHCDQSQIESPEKKIEIATQTVNRTIDHATHAVSHTIESAKRGLVEGKETIKSTISDAVHGGDKEYEEGKRKANETMDNAHESLSQAGRQASGVFNSLLHKASGAVTGAIATTYRKVVEAAVTSEHALATLGDDIATVTQVPDHIPLPTPILKEQVTGHTTATYNVSPLASIPRSSLFDDSDPVEPIDTIKVVYPPPAPAPLSVEKLVPTSAPVLVSSPLPPASVDADIALDELQAKAEEAVKVTADVAALALEKGKEAAKVASEKANVLAEKSVVYSAKAKEAAIVAKEASVDAAAAGVEAIHFASGAAHAVAERTADKLAAGKEAASEYAQYAKAVASVAAERGAAVASVVAERGIDAVATAAGVAGAIVGATEAALTPVATALAPVASQAAHLASDAASSAAHLASDVADNAAHLASDAALAAKQSAANAAHLASDAALNAKQSAANAAHLASDAASSAKQSAANAVTRAASTTTETVSTAAEAVKDAVIDAKISAKSALLGDGIVTDELAAQIISMTDAEYEKKHAELLKSQLQTAEALRLACASNKKPTSHEELRLKREAALASAHLRSAEALRAAQKQNPRPLSGEFKKTEITDPSHALYRLSAAHNQSGKSAQ